MHQQLQRVHEAMLRRLGCQQRYRTNRMHECLQSAMQQALEAAREAVRTAVQPRKKSGHGGMAAAPPPTLAAAAAAALERVFASLARGEAEAPLAAMFDVYGDGRCGDKRQQEGSSGVPIICTSTTRAVAPRNAGRPSPQKSKPKPKPKPKPKSKPMPKPPSDARAADLPSLSSRSVAAAVLQDEPSSSKLYYPSLYGEQGASQGDLGTRLMDWSYAGRGIHTVTTCRLLRAHPCMLSPPAVTAVTAAVFEWMEILILRHLCGADQRFGPLVLTQEPESSL